MRKQILKTQLLFLFIVALCEFFYLFFLDSLPGNSFEVSSTRPSGLIGHFVSSALSWHDYFVGPLGILQFAVFAFFAGTVFFRRQALLDVWFFPLEITCMILGSFLFLPELLGEGTLLPLTNILSTTDAHFLLWPLFVLSIVIIFRSKCVLFLSYLVKAIGRICVLSYHQIKKKLQSEREPIATASIPFSDELEKPVEPEPYFINEEPEEIIEKKTAANLPSEPFKYDEKSLLRGLTPLKKKIQVSGPDESYFEGIVSAIEDKLGEFRISAQVINILKGPVVDTYELELGPGVKVSKVTSITEDLGLALYGAPIRLVYPMKGKTTLGIEVPRNPREIIYLDDVLKSTAFRKTQLRLPIAVGKDSFGNSTVVDLAGMPHMLVAGSTGSGKSVFINTLLVSLLVKRSPEEMKLILIDPKQLELALYANLPHLLLPVMTDPKSASLSLLWAVQEMERRYSILKEMGVRNIEGYNKKLETEDEVASRIQHLFADDAESLALPYIVIIIDEFADLILTKMGKEIETNICRLAAKARAAGIHLVLATQRPSVDVITGLIKSNFPTRVSFRVTSNIDSRTILNTVGAEKLLGMGDMLYKHGIEMGRLHSAYIAEEEIEALMDKLALLPSSVSEKAVEFIESGGQGTEDEEWSSSPMGSHLSGTEDDVLYDEAVRVVCEQRAASASMLQRRLRIGYNRAANLVEEMEQKGIVGPQQGSRPRKVLASLDGL